jgi:hypothetical protein
MLPEIRLDALMDTASLGVQTREAFLFSLVLSFVKKGKQCYDKNI